MLTKIRNYPVTNPHKNKITVLRNGLVQKQENQNIDPYRFLISITKHSGEGDVDVGLSQKYFTSLQPL